jgi:uncharacterized protein (DUF1501 family)
MSSASSTLVHVLALQPVTEKLAQSNFPLWRALVVSALMGAQLTEFLDDDVVALGATLITDDKKTKVHNLEFAAFVAKQQQVLNFLFSSLSKEMLQLVASCSTPHEVWENLVTMSSSQSLARVINT